MTRGWLLIIGLAACGGGGRSGRPTTFGEVCREVGTLTCAVQARRDECANQTTNEGLCVNQFVAECCSDEPGSPLPCSMSQAGAPSFTQYDDCHAAIDAESCTDIDADVRPPECDGVAP